MKKSIFFALFLTINGLINAKSDGLAQIDKVFVSPDVDKGVSTAIDQKIEFIKMKKNHLKAWFNFRKKFKTKEMDLFKKHHSEHFDNRVVWLKEIKSKGVVPELTKQHLLQTLELDQKQADEDKQLFAEKAEEALKIKEQQDKDRAQLKAS